MNECIRGQVTVHDSVRVPVSLSRLESVSRPERFGRPPCVARGEYMYSSCDRAS